MMGFLNQRIMIVLSPVFIGVLLVSALGKTKPPAEDMKNWLCRHPWETDAEASVSAGGSPLKGAWGACFSTLPSAEPADSSAEGISTKPKNSIAQLDQQTWIVCPQGPPVCRFTQIQDAIDAAPEGTTIVIKSGTYEENVIVRKSLTLQAVEGEHVIIKSSVERFPTLLLVSGWYPIYVEIRGITFHPARPQQGNGIEILGMVAARLERNTFDDYEFAILVIGKEAERGLSKLPVVITENTIHSIIGIRNSASVEISKNSLKPKATEATVSALGITIEASGSIRVLENLIEGGAVWISHSFDVDIERNIIRSGFGINIEKISQFVTLSGNQIEQNAWGVAVTRGSLEVISKIVSE